MEVLEMGGGEDLRTVVLQEGLEVDLDTPPACAPPQAPAGAREEAAHERDARQALLAQASLAFTPDQVALAGMDHAAQETLMDIARVAHGLRAQFARGVPADLYAVLPNIPYPPNVAL